MKRPSFEQNWPASWKSSYAYDSEEIFGPSSNRGYAYAYQNRRRATLALITEVLPRSARILDVAAAQGNFSLTLAEMGYEVTWNDRREELADYVRLKHESGVVHFAPGDAFAIAQPELFDAALITEVIEHTAHPDQFLAHIATLVRPGGYVVMSTPNGAYFRNDLPKFSECADPAVYEAQQFKPDSDGHIFLLHPEEIFALSGDAGLVLEKLQLLTNPLTAGHMKTRPLLRVIPAAFVRQVEKFSARLPAVVQRRLFTQIVVRLRKPDMAAI